MPFYRVSVEWEGYGHQYVEAPDAEAAREIAQEMPLPIERGDDDYNVGDAEEIDALPDPPRDYLVDAVFFIRGLLNANAWAGYEQTEIEVAAEAFLKDVAHIL